MEEELRRERGFREISLTREVETSPVVITGERWQALREDQDVEHYFRMFPECRRDPLRNTLGGVRAFPPPFSRGGGLFPVLLRMDDGNLCCATRTGAPHVGSGGEISLSFSEDRGKTWSDYRVAVRGDTERHLDCRNPALGQAADGHLVLAYGVMTGYDAAGRNVKSEGFTRRMEVIRSGDQGRTWSAPVFVESPEIALLHPHGQMRRLTDGTLIFNARGPCDPGARERDPGLPGRMSYLYRSSDGGCAWEEPDLIRPGASETGFLPLDEQRWVAYVRFNNEPNRIAHSCDGGKTWPRWEDGVPGTAQPGISPPPSDLTGGDWRLVGARVQKPSPGSLAILPGGKVLVTYGYRAYPFGVRAILSRDGGQTFDLTREYVLCDTAYHYDCGYPSTVCCEDGTVVTVAYSILDLAHPEWGTCCAAYRYPQDLFD